MQVIFEPAHGKTYNKTYVSNKNSDQPVHPPSMARVLVHSSLDILEAVEGTCDQRRLIRQRGCAGWSEFQLVAQVWLQVLSCESSIFGRFLTLQRISETLKKYMIMRFNKPTIVCLAQKTSILQLFSFFVRCALLSRAIPLRIVLPIYASLFRK